MNKGDIKIVFNEKKNTLFVDHKRSENGLVISGDYSTEDKTKIIHSIYAIGDPQVLAELLSIVFEKIPDLFNHVVEIMTVKAKEAEEKEKFEKDKGVPPETNLN